MGDEDLSNTTPERIREIAEAESRDVLGCGLDEAFERLDRGELAGTAMEAELSTIRGLLAI